MAWEVAGQALEVAAPGTLGMRLRWELVLRLLMLSPLDGKPGQEGTCPLSECRDGFPGGSAVKNLPTTQETEETWVRSLGQEDPLEEGMATHSSTLAWRTPWTEEPGGLQSTGSQSWTPLSDRQHSCVNTRALPERMVILVGPDSFSHCTKYVELPPLLCS